MSEVRLEYLRPGQVLEEMRRLPLVYLPVGTLEWHAPHLPLGTDMLLAHDHAVRLAQEVGGVVHPAIYCGTERERPAQMLRDIGFGGDEWIVGMDFPANSMPSLYYPEESFALMLREALALLAGRGYRMIAIVNGHGAENHINVLQRLAAAYNAEGKTRVVVLVPFPLKYDEQGRQSVAAGHADIYETATMLSLHPETVDLATLPPPGQPLHNTDWAIVDSPTFSGNPTPDHTVRPAHDPRGATAEMGAGYIAGVMPRVVEELRRALAEAGLAGDRGPSRGG